MGDVPGPGWRVVEGAQARFVQNECDKGAPEGDRPNGKYRADVESEPQKG